tara:strand:+ start:283 stop:1002 length:720 start_codon:yes stop_codon:yes gene_type:complete
MKDIELYVKAFSDVSAVDIFKAGGISPIIDKIKQAALAHVPDMHTDKGRKEIASLAHKVSKSKALLDSMGKDLADNLNAQLKPINAERKKCRDELDALRDEIRQPLTDYEQAEKEKAKAAQLLQDVADCLEVAYLMNDAFNVERQKLADENARQAEIQAAKDAQRKADELAEAVQAGISADRKAAEDLRIAREANTQLKASVNNSILQALSELGATNELAKAIIFAIHKGKIPHTSITY